jgi:hypothetical protein
MTHSEMIIRDADVAMRALRLRSVAFAALVAGEPLGGVAGDEALPKALRRRMSPYDAGVARCAVGVATPGADEEIVFASRYGNMALTLDLLVQVVGGEVLSPAKFSMSVHNAAAGAASLIAQNRAGHTAVAAGAGSLKAGLTEAWARIATGSPSVLLVYSDFPLMSPYAEFDEPGPTVQLATRLTQGPDEGGYDLERGRAGAEGLARALAGGLEVVAWRL